MSCLEQTELTNKNKIQLLFTVKKLADGFLFLFGIFIVVGLFMFFYTTITVTFPPSITQCIDCGSATRRLWKIFMLDFSRSMIISGIIGIIISSPIIIVLGIRLNNRQSAYIKQEYGHNKDFIKFLRNSNKIVRSPKLF